VEGVSAASGAAPSGAAPSQGEGAPSHDSHSFGGQVSPVRHRCRPESRRGPLGFGAGAQRRWPSATSWLLTMGPCLSAPWRSCTSHSARGARCLRPYPSRARGRRGRRRCRPDPSMRKARFLRQRPTVRSERVEAMPRITKLLVEGCSGGSSAAAVHAQQQQPPRASSASPLRRARIAPFPYQAPPPSRAFSPIHPAVECSHSAPNPSAGRSGPARGGGGGGGHVHRPSNSLISTAVQPASPRGQLTHQQQALPPLQHLLQQHAHACPKIGRANSVVSQFGSVGGAAGGAPRPMARAATPASALGGGYASVPRSGRGARQQSPAHGSHHGGELVRSVWEGLRAWPGGYPF
jgi:hypothetical protein